MNLIILGAPGSGKGTQAKLIAEKFNLTHLSSGALLRQESETDTPKGKLIKHLLSTGDLLPFETVLEVIEPAITAATSGFILDGTPRDLHQAEYLDYFLKTKNLVINKVIYLTIPPEETLKRLLKRASLEGRSDDTEAVIKERLSVYQNETLPVIDHYEKLGLLLKIDGTPTIEAIFTDIVNHLSIA